MDATPGSARRGSSFTGPRRGTDPEGGERSAWKGLCGPSGLNLDHARIPDIRETVYAHLAPLVVAAPEPLPLSVFTSKCCDVLLPVLEKERELGPHAFKSQFGRLNEFVCPELARRAGIPDCGFNREAKTVRLDLAVALSSHTAGQGRSAASSGSPSSSPGQQRAAPAAAAQPAAPAPAPLVLAPAPVPAGPAPVLLPPALLPPCAYCHAAHAMRHCPDFHGMLQAVYQTGFQRGVEAAAVHQAAPGGQVPLPLPLHAPPPQALQQQPQP